VIAKKKRLWIGLALLGVVCAAAYPLWSAWQNYLEKEKEKRAKADIVVIEEATKIWNENYGSFPPCLEVLAEPQPNGDPAVIDKRMLVDPWGQNYVYDSSSILGSLGRDPHIYSQGPPGQGKFISNRFKD